MTARMVLKRWPALVSVLLVLLLGLGSAGADSAPLLALAPGLTPTGSTTVRMESERIALHLGYQNPQNPLGGGIHEDVQINFHFQPAKDERMTAGFPLRSSVPQGDLRRDGEAVTNFALLQDGKPLAYELQNVTWAGEETQWAVWTFDFRAQQPVVLDVSYRMNIPGGKGQSRLLPIFYLLRTGSYWAGTIGRADAVLSADWPLEAAAVGADTTKGWQVANDRLAWSWTDLKPAADLTVGLQDPRWWNRPALLGALLDKPTLSADEWQTLLGNWSRLYGDEYSGPQPLRGHPSNAAGDALWPRVQAKVAAALAANPGDAAFRAEWLAALVAAAYGYDDPYQRTGPHLYSAERLRLYLAERGSERPPVAAPGSDAARATWYLVTSIYDVTPDADLRRQALAPLLRQMPSRFDLEQTARAWVEGLWQMPGGLQLSQVPAQYAEVEALVRTEALARVAAVPAVTSPGPDATGQVAAAPAVPEPATGFPWSWLLLGVGAVGLGGAGLLAWRKRRGA